MDSVELRGAMLREEKREVKNRNENKETQELMADPPHVKITML
jgi:hypothetical protein